MSLLANQNARNEWINLSETPMVASDDDGRRRSVKSPVSTIEFSHAVSSTRCLLANYHEPHAPGPLSVV